MNNEKKTLGYYLGQFLGVVIVLCITALVVGVTISLLGRIF